MQAAVPSILGVVEGGPLVLVSADRLAPGVAFSRASTGLALAADGTSWASVASGSPRFHGAARRLLIEPSRTNRVTNPRAEGTVAGTPGTAPTSWGGDTNGRTIYGTATSSGLSLLDIGYTIAAAGNRQLAFEASVIAAAAGETWTASGFVQGVSGSGVTVRLDLEYRDSGNAVISGGSLSSTTVTPDGTLRRLVVTHVAPAGTARVTTQWRLANGTGASATVRVLHGATALELAPSTSSPMLPPAGSPGSFTRAADAASLALSGARAAQGTLVLRAMVPQLASPGLDQGLLQLDDGTDANRVLLRNTAGGGGAAALVVSGGTTLATLAGGTITAGAPFRAVLAWGSGGVALCLAGGTVQTTATAPPPGINRLLVGHGAVALNRALCGELERLELHAARLPDATLLALANS